jgi:hypothetical protein
MRAALLASLLLLLVPAASQAAPPQTGFEAREGASFTTHEEEVAFLNAVVAGSARTRLSQIGTTKQGRPLHLVELGSPAPAGRDAALRRPTALIVCSQHGNEPAGREACLRLLRDLAFTTDPAQVALLERTTFLFVPSANPDGRAANTRENTDVVDINRDHLTLDAPEAQAMAAVVRDWEPDVALDLHEYGPSQPVLYDDSILWLWPRNLNTDAAVHDLAIELGRKYLVPAANAAGYGADEYGQQEVADNDVAQTAGDADEGIMRNAMGLRHVLGILVETRVDADARQSPSEVADAAEVARRRVDSHMSVLSGLLKFMTERGAEAARVTAEASARKAAEGAAQAGTLYFDGADNAAPTEEGQVKPPPCGYQLSAADFASIQTTFDLHGIRTTPTPSGPFVSLGQSAEPLIPLLIDARGKRHKLSAPAVMSGCPAPPPAAGPGTPPAGPPKAPAASCIRKGRTVTLRLPRPKGRVVSAVVRANGKKVRVRRGVAYVRVTRTVKLVITQRVRSKGKTRTRRSTRQFKVCR